jgi:transcriptional regulator with XRE-family HTH domain
MPFEAHLAGVPEGRQDSINPRDDMPELDKRRVFRSRPALRDLRLRAGLTEQALAARLGVTSLTIKAWEKGERPQPHKEWLLKLAAALGCSVTDVRPGEGVARRKRWGRAFVSLARSNSPPTPAQIIEKTWPADD